MQIFSSDLSIVTVRRHVEASVTGEFSWKRAHLVPFYRVPQKQRGLVKAVTNSGDHKSSSAAEVASSVAVVAAAAKQVQVDQENESVSSSASASTRSDGIDVKAVITIRKKMKEKLSERIEDQWESFIIGIGQGILIQLISQDIDPG